MTISSATINLIKTHIKENKLSNSEIIDYFRVSRKTFFRIKKALLMELVIVVNVLVYEILN